MRRIIASALAAALTGCSEPVPRAAEEAPPAVAAPAADAAGSAGSASNAPGGTTAAPVTPAAKDVILFVGTSLTAGYGIGADLAYPAVLQQKLDSARLPFRVSNAGISGETSAGGLRRIDWALQAPIAVLVLELGANDGLRGLDPRRMEDNLDEIMARTRVAHPQADIVLLGMEAPPNLGPAYVSRFRNVYRDLARRHDAVLVPFLLEGVAGDPALNQRDGLHPTAAGQRLMAETVWRALLPVLQARTAQRASSDPS